jgi:hypothetical protein
MSRNKQGFVIYLFIVALMFAPIHAEAASAPKPGDVLGEVLSTDIRAMIKGSPIPSMNVNGLTAVVAEDLRSYGFDVAWVPQQRKVVVQYREGKPILPLPETASSQTVGSKMADVWHTDIQTFYGDTPIRSYNIGGRTAILINDLSQFGQVEWLEKERTITFTPSAAADGKVEYARTSPVVIRQIGEIRIDGIAIGNQTITHDGEVIGRMIDDKPMVSVQWMAERFRYETVEEQDGALYINSGTYGFRLYAGQSIAPTFWFGSPAGQFELFVAPVKRNGEWLVYETDLNELFGYYSVWDPDTRVLSIEYRDYITEDYGVDQRINNYYYSAYADGYISTSRGTPSVYVRNRINGQFRSGPGGGNIPEGAESGGGAVPNYQMMMETPLDIGRNELEVAVQEDVRLLFFHQFEMELTMERIEPIIRYSDAYSFGDYTKLTSVSPEQAYISTSEGELVITGEVGQQIGSELIFEIEKMNGGQTELVSKTAVSYEESRFIANLALPDEPGLYRITAVSQVSHPRGTASAPIAKWYVER